MTFLDKVKDLLEIGVRPITLPINIGDIKEAYALVPTYKGDWIRDYLRIRKTEWEGSYIPLLIYKNGTGAVLVPAGEKKIWEPIVNKLEEVLEIKIEIRGD